MLLIGIDKTTINGIGITSINFKKLMVNDNVIWSREGTCISIPTNIPSQYQEVSYLKITDEQMFNTLSMGVKVCGGKMIPYCLLELHIRSACGDNSTPLNIEAYKQMLKQIKKYIYDRYGIILNFNDIGFKELEINCTFKLNEPFKEYEYLLERLIEVAPRRYKQALAIRNEDRNITEIKFLNKSANLKVYDKKYQLEEAYKIKINDDLIRIEYTFNRSQKVEDVFGTSKVNQLTDEAIRRYIVQAIENDLIKPIYKHIDEANKQLLKIARQYQKLYPRGWGKKFIADSRTLKITKKKKETDEIIEENKMLLVDNQQLKDIIKAVAKKKETAKRLYKEIECIKPSNATLKKLEYIHNNIN